MSSRLIWASHSGQPLSDTTERKATGVQISDAGIADLRLAVLDLDAEELRLVGQALFIQPVGVGEQGDVLARVTMDVCQKLSLQVRKSAAVLYHRCPSSS